jgi:hypothetical protein
LTSAPNYLILEPGSRFWFPKAFFAQNLGYFVPKAQNRQNLGFSKEKPHFQQLFNAKTKLFKPSQSQNNLEQRKLILASPTPKEIGSRSPKLRK